MNRMFLAASVLAALLALAACGSDAPAKAAPKAAAAAPVDPAAKPDAGLTVDGGVAVVAEVAEYVYSPVAKRDPFRSYFDEAPVQAEVKAETPTAHCGPICGWELEQLKLVAVVTGIASPVAMVEDPDGRGFLLRRGSYVGKRSGKVSDIRRDAVVVTELIRRRDGALIPAKSELVLRDKKGKGSGSSKEAIIDLSAASGQNVP